MCVVMLVTKTSNFICQFNPFQGLYEYVRPAWEARPRPPKVDLDLKTFGATLPARPTLGDGADSDKNGPL